MNKGVKQYSYHDKIAACQLLLYRSDHSETALSLISAIDGWLPGRAPGLAVDMAVGNLGGEAPRIGGEVGSRDSIPDIICSLRGEPSELLAQAGLLAAHIRRLIDPGRSSVLGAERYEILSGEGPVQLFYGICRLPSLSREAFHDYWLGTHAALGRRLIPPYSYFQSHARAGLTAKLSSICQLPPSTLDGVVNIHFPDMEAFNRQIAREDVKALALEDEKKFIDHQRVQFGAYTLKTY